MPNLPGRNGVASSIHYPLPQPATTPLSQGNKQQVVGYFTLPLGLTQVLRIAIFGILSVVPRIETASLMVSPRIEVETVSVEEEVAHAG